MVLVNFELVLSPGPHALAKVVAILHQRSTGVISLHYERDRVRVTARTIDALRLSAQLNRVIDVLAVRPLEGTPHGPPTLPVRTTYVVSRSRLQPSP